MEFNLNDRSHLETLELCRETALRQLADIQPQNVDGFFDLIGRLPNWFIYRGFGVFQEVKRHMDESKQILIKLRFAIEQCGALAPFYNEDQIEAYADFVGISRVAEECNYVFCKGLPYSDAAARRINSWRNRFPDDWVIGAERKLYPIDKPLMLPPAQTASPATVPVGTNTRLNAIDVPVSAPALSLAAPKESQTRLTAIEATVTPSDSIPLAVPPEAIAQAVQAVITPEQPKFKNPVEYLIGDRLRSALIVAVSGGGKDYLLSHAVRYALNRLAGYKLVILDCKDDPKEYGYYPTHPSVSVHRLNIAVASDSEILEWANDALNEFVNIPEKAILVCNEGTGLRPKCKRYLDIVSGLVSSGDSREKYAWEAGQSAHTDDLLINSAARSRFRPLVIGMKGEEMQIEAVLRACFVADSARNMTNISHEMSRSPVHRAWSDGRNWFAMPSMTNYAGYDRDSRSFINAPQKVVAGEEIKPTMLDDSLSIDAIVSPAKPKPVLKPKSAETKNKGTIKKPNLSEAELKASIVELKQWKSLNPAVKDVDVYEKWKHRKHGFSRPEIRFLLTLI